MESKIYLPILIVLTSLVLIGYEATVEIGKMKVVDESGSKEDWIKSDKDYFERDNKIYFRGMVTDRKDLAYDKLETRAEAIKILPLHRILTGVKFY